MIKKLSLIFIAFMAFASPLISQQQYDFSAETTPLYPTDSTYRVAVYNDAGVWNTGYSHLKLFFREHQIDYTSIDANDIRDGQLSRDRFDIVVLPGGQSWTYLDSLEEEGAEHIKQFVSSGGGFIGICAGAFYAISDREGGHTTGPYGIGLLTGVGYDGTRLGTPPFRDGMLKFSIDYPNIQAELSMVLLEGPSILLSDEEIEEKEVRIISRYPEILHPAMTLSTFGEGRVYLTGPHPEIEESRLGWGRNYQDPETDWPLLKLMFDEVAPENE